MHMHTYNVSFIIQIPPPEVREPGGVILTATFHGRKSILFLGYTNDIETVKLESESFHNLKVIVFIW
jgi:hypothetical protein